MIQDYKIRLHQVTKARTYGNLEPLSLSLDQINVGPAVWAATESVYLIQLL